MMKELEEEIRRARTSSEESVERIICTSGPSKSVMFPLIINSMLIMHYVLKVVIKVVEARPSIVHGVSWKMFQYLRIFKWLNVV